MAKKKSKISPDFIGDDPETMKEGTITPMPKKDMTIKEVLAIINFPSKKDIEVKFEICDNEFFAVDQKYFRRLGKNSLRLLADKCEELEELFLK